MITRSFDQGEKADSQNKTMWPKGTGHCNAIRLAIPGVDQMRYTADSQTAVNEYGRLIEPLQITVIWLSTDSRYSKATDESCVYQKEFWYRKRVP